MRPLTRALATTALSGCLVLAGCGGNPTPAPPPKASTSPTPSASATPTPPALPAVAREKTKAGAVAATRHFIDALNYAVRNGDTAGLRTLYISLCTRCEDVADGIDKTYREGGRISGGEWRTRVTKFYAVRNDVAYIDAIVDYDSQEFEPSSGAAPKKFPASRNHLKAFNLRWNAARGWQVSALDPNQ